MHLFDLFCYCLSIKFWIIIVSLFTDSFIDSDSSFFSFMNIKFEVIYIFSIDFRFKLLSVFSFVDIKFELDYMHLFDLFCYCLLIEFWIIIISLFTDSFIDSGSSFFSFVNIKFEVRLCVSFRSILDSSFFLSFCGYKIWG